MSTFKERIQTRMGEMASDAIDDQLSGLMVNPSAIRDKMVATLINEQRAVLFRFLGMEERGGEIKRDACNGHKGPAEKMFEDIAQVAYTEWLYENREVIRDEIKRSLTKARPNFIKEMKSEFDYKMRQEIRNILHEEIKLAAREALKAEYPELEAKR